MYKIEYRPDVHNKGQHLTALSYHDTYSKALASFFVWSRICPNGCFDTIKTEHKLDEKLREKLKNLIERGDVNKPESYTPEPIDLFLKRLKMQGVEIYLDGVQPRIKGKIEESDKKFLVENRADVIKCLSRTESQPYSKSLDFRCLKECQVAFKETYDKIIKPKDCAKLREAAFSLILDGLTAISEACEKQNGDELLQNTKYFSWLCAEIRINFEKLRDKS